ncbi:MAG: hypothetical protein ABJZ69_00440, partial [Hyphomicrobiales bacterium]
RIYYPEETHLFPVGDTSYISHRNPSATADRVLQYEARKVPLQPPTGFDLPTTNTIASLRNWLAFYLEASRAFLGG